MKKIFLFFYFFCWGGSIYSQQVVSAPAIEGQLQLHYVESINQVALLRENIIKAKEAIKEISDVKDEIGTMRTELSTIYNNTFGIFGEVNDLVKEIEKTPSEIEHIMQEFKKNAECLFDDIDQYQQIETIYRSKYVFVDPDVETLSNGATTEDRHVFDDGSDGAGALSPLQLVENPCMHEVTYYSQMVSKAKKEKEELQRLIGSIFKTEDQIKKETEELKKLEKKIKNSKTLKESADTSKPYQIN